MTIPALPPGFELVEDDAPVAQQAMSQVPPLPPGFEMVDDEPPPLEIEIVGGKTQAQRDAEERSISESIGRELGLGGRAVMRGVGDVVGLFGGDLVTGIEEKVTGKDLRSFREGADYWADRIGLPRPETASERVGADMTSALTGTGLTLGAGAIASRLPGVAGAVGRGFTAAPRAQGVAAITGPGAAGVVRENGGGTGAQLAAGLAGGLAPAGFAPAFQAVVSNTLRGGAGGRERAAQTINAFREVGAQPSVGQAVGNMRTQAAESALAALPTSSGRMTQFAEQQAAAIGEGLKRRADALSPNASAERAGRAVAKGADDFALNVRETRQRLYETADAQIPAATSVPLANTLAALDKLTTTATGAKTTGEAMLSGEVVGLAQRIKRDLFASQTAGPMGSLAPTTAGIPFSTVRAIRSDIGENLADFALVPSKDRSQYKELYRALSNDLEAVAAAQGPAATQAMRRANNYTRASSDRLEQLERVVDKNGGPEKIYAAVMSGTQDGGTTLRAVMQSLPKEGQKALTGAIIKRMGLATPGQQDASGELFSANTFLTNWNRLSPEARRAVFDRHGAGFSASMDRIAQVAETLRTGSKVYANPSGSANKIGLLGYVVALATTAGSGRLTEAGTLVAGGALANGVSRFLTNPRIVAWMGSSANLPVSALPQQVAILRGVAERADDTEMAEFADALAESAPQ